MAQGIIKSVTPQYIGGAHKSCASHRLLVPGLLFAGWKGPLPRSSCGRVGYL